LRNSKEHGRDNASGCSPWWNTRLHLVAALSQDLGGTREFVFVDEKRRFLTTAPPREIRCRLGQRWPALEQAYAAFRNGAETIDAVERDHHERVRQRADDHKREANSKVVQMVLRPELKAAK
jgi:hypothetical protein